MNRRELLKYFAAGTLITPVTGAKEFVAAQLVEAPRIKPIEVPRLVNPIALNRIKGLTLTLTMDDDSIRQLPLENPYFEMPEPPRARKSHPVKTAGIVFGPMVYLEVRFSDPHFSTSPRCPELVGAICGESLL